MVLVEQAAETVGSLDTVPVPELPVGQIGDRLVEVDAAVRALVVVVGHELSQHSVEMALAADQQPVQALGPCRADKSFREGVCSWRSDGRADDPGADRAHDLVKWPDELGVPVADQVPDGPRLVV